MKRILLTLLCTLLAAAPALAQSGESCEDAIPVKDGFVVSPYAGQDVWYSAWTYDLPLTVRFTPTGNDPKPPTITADFTCTPGHYDNPKLQEFLVDNGNLQFQMPYPLKLDTRKDADGKPTYILSMDKSIRDQFSAYLGITENLQVYVHAIFPEEGSMEVSSDVEYAECMESGRWIKLGEEFPVTATTADAPAKTYNIAMGDWRKDSVRIIWKGDAEATIHLGVNDCKFAKDDDNYRRSYYFKAGGDTIKISNDEIKNEFLKNDLQTGGIYYMHIETSSNGTMLFEKQPEPEALGGAERLEIDEASWADSTRLYYFPRAWKDSNIVFTTPAVNRFRMVVASAPFDTDKSLSDEHILASYQFAKTDEGHEQKLTKAQMAALVGKIDAKQRYLYVRFYCIDPKAKVTPQTWTPSACEQKVTPIYSGVPVSMGKYSGNGNYQFLAKEWCGSDLTIQWAATSSITLQAYVNNKCDLSSAPSSASNANLIWSTRWNGNKAAMKGGTSLTIPAATTQTWIDKADGDYLYIYLAPTGNGTVTITSAYEEQEEEIPEVKMDSTFITIENAAETHLMTGLAAGYTTEAKFEGSTLRDVNLSSCFGTDGMPLFDELYVFTTTTTTQTQTQTITAATNKAGSNAKTPCYIYHRDEEGYRLISVVENVNTSEPIVRYISLNSAGLEQKSVYITGFAPYASTGWTASDEGVFYLRGGEGDKMDVYLEDAYIYSRNKTISGAISTASSGNNTYTSDHACASGAVLVFECMDKQNAGNPFQATIHIKGRNQLMSVNGHFFAHVAGNVNHPCAPVEIHLTDKDAAENVPSYTELNLTDEWNGVRTHGFLSLQKSANNAPSIDLGNKYTVLNMRGGQVELQNAQVMSNNYKNTMAISYRDGKVGNVFMSYGIGSDNAGGTLNFWDGTTSVIPMKVQEEYRQYYLMDADGETTSCLRCPANTHVYGGSQCWLRACQNVESKGGAPMGYNDVPVGQIVYTAETLSTFNSKSDCIGGTYGIESIDPDSKGNYYFWIPASCDPSIRPEQDQQTQFWLAAMTSIEAEFGGFGGKVGGDVTVGDKQVSNLLYCAIDDNISTIITETDENDQYIYQAPVKNPTGSDYVRISPSYVGYELSNNVLDDEDYTIQNHIYYICPTSADEWRLFAAPFDVKRLWVVETYDENLLRAMEGDEENYLTQREVVMYEQARHNADFAGFFGVVLALGSNTPFDKIFEDYISWAKQEDKAAGRWDGKSEYTLRGRKELTAGKDFYLSEVKTSDIWTMQEGDTTMSTPWQTSTGGEMLMRKGQIYRMLFPYKYGNGNNNHNENENDDEEWDYWSGKLLIFEGDGPQTLYGRKSLRELQQSISVTERNGHVSGNFSLSNMESITHLPKDVYQFIPEGMDGQFYLLDDTSIDEYNPLHPSEAFLVASIPTTETLGEPTNVHVESGLISYYKEEEEIGTGIFSPALKVEGVVRKIMHNGELYIIRGGEIYNIIGRQLR